MYKSRDRQFDNSIMMLANLKIRINAATKEAMQYQKWEDKKENKKRYKWWKVLLCWIWKMFCGGGTV